MISKSEHIIYGADIVSGVVIGDISHRYNAMMKTVMVWPKHNHREEWPAKPHGFWSTLTSRSEAVAEYITSNRRESLLGDGTPCIITLEEVA
jgi:hypothetical protein